MGILKTYCHLLAEHPLKIIVISVTSILVSFMYTINKYPLPSFKDPLVGFEARTTRISSRINTYKLLLEETSLFMSNSSNSESSIQSFQSVIPTYPPYFDRIPAAGPPIITESRSNSSTSEDTSDSIVLDIKYSKKPKPSRISDSESNNEYIDEEDEIENYNAELTHFSIGHSMFCGKLFDDYAQVVIVSTGGKPNTVDSQGTSNLFTLESLLSICAIDKKLRLEAKSTKEKHRYLFQKDCERYRNNDTGSSICCNSWSLPNYVACLANKTSCSDIVQNDLDLVHRLFITCAPYFHQMPNDDCYGVNQTTTNKPPVNLWNVGWYSSPIINCNSIPEECRRCDNWIFSVMNYLVDVDFIKTSFIQDNKTENLIASSTTIGQLHETNIFLPIAKSDNLQKYYEAISNSDLNDRTTQVSAMNLGLKNSVFDLLIVNDTKFFILALIINLIIISIYSRSFVISMTTLSIICLSLCLSYVLYKAIGMPIFPFMNLLAIIISSGICPDNAMLFCKPWKCIDTNNIGNDLERIYTKSIKDTFLASPATTIALSASYISHVVAIKCFSVFAMLSVLTNYFLIVTLLPPVLILEKKHKGKLKGFLEASLDTRMNLYSIKTILEPIKSKINRGYIYLVVVKFKFTLVSLFLLVYVISAVVVLYYPQFSPPDNDEFQLLSSDHEFELYDTEYKRRFWYQISKNKDYGNNYEHFTLPIRIVFGVKSIDNGNILDPNDRGSLTYDPKFDMSDPKAQVWMLDFCSKLRQQKFVASPVSLSLTGCFIETFKSWIENRPCRDPIFPEHSREPCCETSHFPYSKNTFNRCLGQAIDLVHRTPHFGPQTKAGPRFLKNTNKLAAIIIEYYSNQSFTNSYSRMNGFWTKVNDWVTWQIKNTAPTSLKSGWFSSDNLELLALQEELLQGTSSTVVLEIFFAMIALFIGTGNLSLCLVGSLTISAIMTTTVAILIAIGWSLNIVESICISLATGLSVDFALHNTISFKHSIQRSRDMTISKVIDYVASPIALATVTTLVAGFTIIWSNILAYQQIGKFLIIIAATSWIMSTFFLLPLLGLIGPTQERSTFGSCFKDAIQKCLKFPGEFINQRPDCF